MIDNNVNDNIPGTDPAPAQQQLTNNVPQEIDLDRLLNRLKRQISFGYSDENYATISWLMGLIQPHVEPEMHRRLSECWRNTYTNTCDSRELNRVIRDMRPESSNSY